MKQKPKRRKANRSGKVGKRRVVALASRGLNRDEIAKSTGLTVAKLRSEFPFELSEGRAKAKTARADDAQAEEISKSDYYLLDAISTAFASPFHDPVRGNLIWLGVDGKGARTVEDAFAARKAAPGAFSTARVTKKMDDPEKVARYAKIVAEYRNKTTERKFNNEL